MATIPSISQHHQAPFEGNYQINFGQGGFSGTQSAAPTRWPLEMSPGVISSDGEQPQTLSARSHALSKAHPSWKGFLA